MTITPSLFVSLTLALSGLYFVVTGIQFWVTDYLTMPVAEGGMGQEQGLVVMCFSICSLTGPTTGAPARCCGSPHARAEVTTKMHSSAEAQPLTINPYHLSSPIHADARPRRVARPPRPGTASARAGAAERPPPSRPGGAAGVFFGGWIIDRQGGYKDESGKAAMDTLQTCRRAAGRWRRARAAGGGARVSAERARPRAATSASARSSSPS